MCITEWYSGGGRFWACTSDLGPWVIPATSVHTDTDYEKSRQTSLSEEEALHGGRKPLLDGPGNAQRTKIRWESGCVLVWHSLMWGKWLLLLIFSMIILDFLLNFSFFTLITKPIIYKYLFFVLIVVFVWSLWNLNTQRINQPVWLCIYLTCQSRLTNLCRYS